jgi:hypothetical protein
MGAGARVITFASAAARASGTVYPPASRRYKSLLEQVSNRLSTGKFRVVHACA